MARALVIGGGPAGLMAAEEIARVDSTFIASLRLVSASAE